MYSRPNERLTGNKFSRVCVTLSPPCQYFGAARFYGTFPCRGNLISQNLLLPPLLLLLLLLLLVYYRWT